MKKKENLLPYFLLSPATILLVLLVFYPIIRTFGYSLKTMSLTEPALDKFIGFANYKTILFGSKFWYSLTNSLVIIVTVLVLSLVIGMLFALLLNVDTKIKGFLTAIVIIPWALPPIVNGIMWRWIFQPQFGFLNKLLMQLDLINVPVNWFFGRFPVILIASLVASWRNIPFCAIVLLSAMQSIPIQIKESANIDGCNSRKLFWKITLPLILPSFGILIVSTLITALNVFDVIVSLVGYGDISMNLMMYDYLTTFQFLNFGLGSAITYILLLLASLLGMTYIKRIYTEVAYL